MSTATATLIQLASQWREARRMYPIYAALVSAFQLGIEPCRDLESPINRSEAEVMVGIQKWFQNVDDALEVWQMRQLLQTSELATDDNLRALIQRHLGFQDKTERVRDKVDYLMVQYYAHVSPHDSHNTAVTVEHVMNVLFPVLGYKETLILPLRDEIEQCLMELNQCLSLGDLLERGILERIRKMKDRAGAHYFDPAVLILFARCNFLVRLGFFRLMHADLHGIRYALHELELKNRMTVDCTEAGFTAQEPLESLRDLCHSWKNPFRKAYSSGSSFKELIAIRAAVEKALAAPDVKEEPKPVEAHSIEASAQVILENKEEPKPVEVEVKAEPVVEIAETVSAVPMAHTQVQEVTVVAAATVVPPQQLLKSHDPLPPPVVPTLPAHAKRQTVAIDVSQIRKSPIPPIQQPAQPVEPARNVQVTAPKPTQPSLQRKKTQIIEVVPPQKKTDPQQPPARAPLTPHGDLVSLPKSATITQAPVKTETSMENTSDLDACLKMIFNKIRSATAPGMTVMIVDLGGTRLTLASWEVMAFARGIDDVAATLRRCVGVRALLCVMVDRIKSGQNADLTTTLTLCHAEASLVQEKVARAKDNNSIDAAVNLAATAKRLLATLEEAEKLALQLK